MMTSILRFPSIMHMTDLNRASLDKYIRSVGVRQIRLACGLVLFAYLLSHFINHALGNISLDALAIGVRYHTAFWKSLPITTVFYAAAAAHAGLGIWVLYSYWIIWPYKMWLMFIVLIVSWVHGCIGLYFWLRMKAFFETAAPFLLAAAVLIPTLAMLGLYQGGQSVVHDSGTEQWKANNLSQRQVGTAAEQDIIDSIVDYFLIGYVGLIGVVLIARGVRTWNERRGGMINLSYGNGRTVRVPKGLSVLEASLRNNVPHASVCGGRARCSTCRIRVIGDCSSLPKPSKREAFVLNRVGAGADPAIRLACQLRPNTDLSFFQIFMPHVTADSLRKAGSVRIGQERYLVSMFVDMRGSTTLAEHRLPFDTVFIVNRFLSAVSQAVIECGGQPNQFVRDRHPWWRSDHRRHRLSRSPGVHRTWRRRQRGCAPAGHDEGPRMRGHSVRGGLQDSGSTG